MKRIATVLMLVMLAILAACEKETVLTVEQTSISIPDNGGSQTVSLTANKPWTVSTNQSWCKVSPSGGEEAASSRVTITCDANTSYDERNCTVTFTCAELTKTVSVTQATNNGLLVSQTSYELTKAAQQLNIEVKANVKFSVEIDADCKDWITYNTTKGLTTNMVVLDIAENKSYDGREGKVTIKQNGGNLSSTITIKQSQLDGLFISTPEYNLSNEKHTLTVEVSTNVEFDVTSEADWVKYVQTKGLNSKQIILEVAENDTYDQRETKVNVKQKNGDIRGTIVIKQDEMLGLLLSQTEFDLGNDSQSIEVEVKANVDYDIIIPSECKKWIKLSQTKSLDTKSCTFSISKNETYDAREGNITFKQKNGALSGTVKVKQSQNNGLFITKSEYEITDDSQTITVEIKANIDFEVKSEADWVKVVETKGLKTSQITLSIEGNDSYDMRSGKVSVKQNNGDLSGTITIKQEGKNGIILPQSEYELTNEAQTIDVEVKSSVQFDVQISDSGKDWVSLVSTKALDTKTCTFAIKKNETYDNRQCTVTVKQKGGNMSISFTIIQAQTDILEVTPTDFAVDVEGGTIEVKVKSNIGYDISIEESATSWITTEDNNASIEDKIRFIIASCTEDVERSGKITISKKDFLFTIMVQQYSFAANTIIKFADEKVKAKLVESFDTNKDGELSIREARAVKSIQGVFGAIKTYKSFDEFKYFTNVTFIPDNCFSDWTLSSIELPPSITRIGKGSFRGCNYLSSITIPQGVKEIGQDAFYGSGLNAITLTDGLETIGSQAFCYCTNLSQINLPHSLTKIGSSAFRYCQSLTSIVIPDSISVIDNSTFGGCNSLTTVYLPNSIKTIGNAAFSNCSCLKEIVIPDSVTKLGDSAFQDCSALFQIKLSSNMTILGKSVFKNCSSLISINIPASLTVINSRVFEKCESLASVSVPGTITAIGEYAFSDCISLARIIIPKNVSSIGIGAFYNCKNLSSFEFPSAMSTISEKVLCKCEKLASVIIPDSVTYISESAFSGCISLLSIELPESVKGIGNGAFRDCRNLSDIIIPKTVASIGKAAFKNCIELKSEICIPEGTKVVGDSTFTSCRKITTISLPESVTSIGNSAFSGCLLLSNISIPNNVSSIGTYAFCSCRSLTEVIIPEGITIISQFAFASCGLKTLRIPNSVTDISYVAFSGCPITSITIPENVKRIGHQAFAGCNQLKSITILAGSPPLFYSEAATPKHDVFPSTNNCPIYVPSESVNTYKSNWQWNVYADRIQAMP